MSIHEEHPDSQSAKHQASSELAKKRDLQALELQRERILSERTSSPHRRAALQAALSDIEAKLTSFNYRELSVFSCRFSVVRFVGAAEDVPRLKTGN
jgi:hypothetical protein